MISFVVLFTLVLGNLVLGNIIGYQIFKDLLFNYSCAFIYIAFMILRKAKIRKKLIFGIVVYACYAIYFLVFHRNDWGWHYCTLLISEFVMYGSLVLLLISTDVLISFREKPLRINFLLILSAMTLFVVLVAGQKYAIPVIIPILLLSAVKPTKEEFNKGIMALSFAAYIDFLIFLSLSFIVAPNVYEGNRYLGFFHFPVVGGLISSIAFLAGIILISFFFEKIQNPKEQGAFGRYYIAIPRGWYFDIF